MWYGYVGPKLGGVTQDYSFIARVVKKIPYATFRGFQSEESAWAFVGSRKHNYNLTSIYKYGDIFDNLHASLEYFITSKGVYANLNTKQLGYVRLGGIPDDVVIEYRADLIKLFTPVEHLSKMDLYSHAVAIKMLLDYIGPIIDIELILDNFSIFYLLTQYTGSKYLFRQVINSIEARTGKVGYTIKSKVGKRDDAFIT
jgi:hypothetical protein